MITEKNDMSYVSLAENDEQSIIKENKSYMIAKRIFDFTAALIAGIILLIPMLLIMLVIVANDFGSPIYCQTRIGKNGKPFVIYKFRTMTVDAEKDLNKLKKYNESCGANFKIENDPRIIRCGHFLRAASIDELPQLWNIIKGDMSFVGPRPFIPEEQEKLPLDRLNVKPGLSCYWQINGKNKLSIEEQIELDMKYIREQSFLVDIKIIFNTIIFILRKKNE